MKSLTNLPPLQVLLGVERALHADAGNVQVTKLTPYFVAGWVRNDRIEPWRPFHITATEYFAANPEAPAVTEGVAPREELFSTSAEDRNKVRVRRAWLFSLISLCAGALLLIALAWKSCSSK